MLEKIDGIVMRTQDYGETHKIVTIFGKNTGKFSAIARGAKKPKSRMAAITQPFIYGNYLVYLGKGLGTIQQGEIIDSYRLIREDLMKTSYTAYILEMTDKIIEAKVPNGYLFKQLSATMNWIAEKDEVAIPIMMYELKLFHIGGFGPVVDQCVKCGNKKFPFAFSIREGGFLCKNCVSLDQEAFPLANKLAKLLHVFNHIDLDRIGNISIKDYNQQLLRNIIDAYYEQYGGYYLKSKRFLKQMDQFKYDK